MDYLDPQDGTLDAEDYGHRNYSNGQRLSYRSREEQLRRRIERYEEELAEIEDRRGKYGEDLPDGAVITFTKTFSAGPNAKRYDYAAIRCNGTWYTTGPKSPKSYTWAELVAWFDGDGYAYGEGGQIFDLKVVTKTRRWPVKSRS